MKKLTKKQHRAAIKNIVSKLEDVQDLRDMQRVAEILEEDEQIREEGSVSNSAESIRLLLDLLAEGKIPEVHDLLYDFWEDVQEDIDGDNIYTEIDDMLHRLSIKNVLFVRGLVRKLLKRVVSETIA